LLTELLAVCARDHQAECDERQLTLDVGPADGLAAAGDPEQVRRALGEVVRNAVEAAPAGGGVRLWAEPAGDRVLVCVADTGPGPAPGVVPHLFDPFFSGRSAGRGRGLGLPIAWRLLRQNGGDLRFDPTAEHPSRFVLSLPVAAALRRSA
jgi:signal transduction histidine kinase